MSSSVTRGSGQRRSAALIFIAITLCLDSLAQSISFPILPRLSQMLLGGDAAAAARWVGFLEVGWAIPQFIAAPILGMLSDRFGRRPVIVVSVFGVGGELLMGALAPNVFWLLLARMLCGFSCGALAAAMAYVADSTPPERRTASFAWVNAALWAGVGLGPALGGVLAQFDIRAPFWIAAAFALANGCFGYFVLPESLPRQNRAPLRWGVANPGAALSILARRGLAPVAFAYFLLWLAFQAKDNMLVLYTAYRYGWTPLAFGVFCSALAIANIAVQMRMTGPLSRRIGDTSTAIVGLCLQVAGFTAMALAVDGTLFWIANAPIALGAVTGPAMNALMTTKVGADEQGRLQGAIGSIASLSSILAPIAFTQLFAWTITWSRDPAWCGATILVGAALTLSALGLVLATRQ